MLVSDKIVTTFYLSRLAAFQREQGKLEESLYNLKKAISIFREGEKYLIRIDFFSAKKNIEEYIE